MAKPRVLAGPHIVRYGTPADQKYLVDDFLETYDQLVVNANMIAHMRGAIASFILQRARKPYFIDPQTHAFQHDISHMESASAGSKGQIKRSFTRLLKAYGEPVETVVGERHVSVLPEDFADPEVRKAFCQRVLQFQMEAVPQQAECSEDSKYYDFLREKGILDIGSFHPAFLVAPYFCLETSNFEQWMAVNLSCAADASEIAAERSVPLAAEIVISRNVLENAEQRDALVEQYSQIDVDSFLVWIDSFSEQDSSEEELSAFVELVTRLGRKAPVVNLYAGFFSVLLVHLGRLAGATHSLEYGEDRAVVPVGGGIPVAKYYVPALHCRLSFRTALRAVRALGGFDSVDAFHEKVCSCRRCRNVIHTDPDVDFLAYGNTQLKNGRQYPTSETMDNSHRHYMWCKAEEFSPGQNARQVLEQLRQTADSLKRDVGYENTEHCRIWADVLSRVVA